MQVIRADKAAPRLLYTVVPDLPDSSSKRDSGNSRFKLKGASVLSGGGGSWLIGLAIGIVVVGGAGEYYVSARHSEPPVAIAVAHLPVETREVTTIEPSATPVPVVMHIDPEILHVTSIALGHPHIAVVNGKSVTEGDRLTVHPASAPSVTVSLQVVKIIDGELQLSNGSEIIRAHIERTSATTVKGK